MDILIGLVVLVLVSIGLYRSMILWVKEKEIKKKAEDLRFLQVKIPVKSNKENDNSDHIQSMKQNIEIMNQAMKNFYAIQGKSKADRVLQQYMVMEVFVEKEVIKFII